MGAVYLCGHTGSENRGCEAILRSTADLLRKCGKQDIYAMTMGLGYDRRIGLDRVLDLIAYPQRPAYIRAISLMRSKLLGDDLYSSRFSHRELFQRASCDDIIFNVGGDTYCYGIPKMSYALNEMAQKKGIPTVFWGCSVDERILCDARMQEDVNRYTYIVARETKSYELLKRVLTDPGKLCLACDPAFTLNPAAVELPENFLAGNTLGLNLSPLVFRNRDVSDTLMLNNVFTLMDNVLEQTGMHICLIPHVYDPDRNTEDIRILRAIYERYTQNSRVCLIEEDLSCAQLKYIVSKCRFFVGARTHPTIAAYSAGVPALAISYSIKSLGIAKDLFEDENRLAVSWRTIDASDALWKQFSEEVLNREQDIREQYRKTLPAYTAAAENVLREILEKV